MTKVNALRNKGIICARSALALGAMALVCVVAFSADGETFYWNGSSAGSESSQAVIGDQYACWTNQTHTTPVVATAGNDYVLRANAGAIPQTAALAGFTFPGESLVVDIGTVSAQHKIILKSWGLIDWTRRTTDTSFTNVKDIRWYRGGFKGGIGYTGTNPDARKRFGTGWSGRIEVLNTGTEPEYHFVGPNGSDEYGPRNVFLKADLVSESGVVIEGSGLNAQGVEASLGGARVYLMGDNSAYKGTFKASDWLTYSLMSDSALGDSATPNAAALQLGTNGGFEIHPAVRLGTSRGVTLLEGATGAYQTTRLDSDRVTNSLAIAGAGVPFRSFGPGTIVYAGAYSAGTWTVEEGTLELTASATFPAGHRFVVKSGATLRLDTSHYGISVEREAGATVVYDPIPYDNATATAVAVDCSASGVPLLPLRIELSERVCRDDDVRIAVLKLPADADVAASDFTLDFDSAIDPLTATFEVVDGAECVTVYLNVGAAVVFTPEAAASGVKYDLDDTEYFDIGGTSVYMWSDHEKAHSGKDYLVTNGAPGTATGSWNGTMTFPGESLCVRGPGKITTRHMRAIFKRIFFGPGSAFEGNGCGYGDLPHWLQAEVTVGGTVDSPASFTSRWGFDQSGGFAKNTTCIDGPILGNGYLRFNGNSLADVRITSTNESFTGGIFLETVANAITNCSLAIRHPYTVGGPLPTSQTNYNALVLGGSYSTLKPLESMVLQTPGRGITVKTSTSGFDVPEDVVLTVREPIRSVSGLTKRGLGTLALGGGWYLGANGNGSDDEKTTAFHITEGRLKVIDGVTLRGTKVFVDGTIALVLDSAATDSTVREYGFFNSKQTSWQIAAGNTVNVELENAAALRRSNVSRLIVPICTVSNEGDESGTQSADRLRGKLNLLRVQGYREKIVEDVPTAYPSMVRFTATYERQGIIFIYR